MMGGIIGGRYRLDRLLGEGGMGSVWAATHLVTGKQVAVKLLKEELARDPTLVERFVREARAACSVVHPNVVQIHDVIQSDAGPPAMIMDLLAGESLGDRLGRGPLTVAELAAVLEPVASAIAAAHRAGIIHRDLKPDNLFLVRRPDGSQDVKVLDFGIAKISSFDGEVGPQTKTGAIVGTPFYMSPEQLFGEKDIDHRADIWSMGIIVWECLVGTRPTQTDSLGQIVKIITQTGIPPLATVLSGVPSEISAIAARMVLLDRMQRPASLDELGVVLNRFRGSTMPPAAPVTSPPAGPALTPSPWSHTNPDKSAPSRARVAAFALAGIVPLAVLTTGAFFLARPLFQGPVVARSSAAPSPTPEPSVPPAVIVAPVVPPSASVSPPTLASAPQREATPPRPDVTPPKAASPNLPIHGPVPF